MNLSIILAPSLINTVKLVMLLDLGTKEFVEKSSYLSENARVAVSLFKLRSSWQTSLVLFLWVAACTRMLVLPSWLSGVRFPHQGKQPTSLVTVQKQKGKNSISSPTGERMLH